VHPREGEAWLGPLSVSTIQVGRADVTGIDPLPAAKPLVDVIEKPDEIQLYGMERKKPKQFDQLHGWLRKTKAI
jgi:hypothetical protein